MIATWPVTLAWSAGAIDAMLLAACALVLSAALAYAAAWHMRHLYTSAGCVRAPRTQTSRTPLRVPCAALPLEIRLYILACAAQPLPRGDHTHPHAGLGTYLLLSRAYYSALAPAAYHTLHVCTPRALHRLRHTLVLLRPELGGYVRALHLAQLPDAIALGMEHLLLAVPALKRLTLDAPSCAALCRSTVERLRNGAQPAELSVVLPSPEAALGVSRTLLTSALFARVRTLRVRATPAAAAALAARLDTHPAALERLEVQLQGTDAPQRVARAALAHTAARRSVALAITHIPLYGT